MRAAALLLVLLVAAPAVDAASWRLLAQRHMDEPGWWAESFELVDSSSIWISFAHRSDSEVVGHMLALYDDAGTLIRGATFFAVGGQIVEATLADGEMRVTNGGMETLAAGGVFARQVVWSCDDACNPSRRFKLAITAGGALDEWGYGLFTQGGARIADAHGSEAWAHTTREFDGTIAHASALGLGAHVARDATLAARAEDRALVTFVKPSAAAPRSMDVDGTVTRACPCFAGDWPAGDYTFRYDDVDARGVEGFLAFADVRLP